MKTASSIFTAVLLLALPAAAQTMMGQTEVEAAFKGATFALTTQGGDTATIAFHPDMTATVTLNDGSTDRGIYRFAEGGYCSIWDDFRDGAEACFTAEDLGSGRYQLYKLDGAKDDLFVRQ
jgi:hypothetical protein